jgi:N-acetylglucosamine-6-sulfatase
MRIFSTADGRPRVAGLVLLGVLAMALLLFGVFLTTHNHAGAGRSPRVIPAGHNSAAPADLEPAGAHRARQSKRPNIVLVLTDDMRTDDLRFMPNVRRLIGDRGLNFRNSFSPYPLCCPARASLLSGQYSHNHHVFSTEFPFGFRAFDDRSTLGTSLNKSGYNTLFLGKYLNGYGDQNVKSTGQSSFRYVPPGWTEWYGAPNRPKRSGYPGGGTYNYFHTIFNVNGTIDDTHKGQYQTDVISRMAQRLIRKYHRSPKPFFMYLAPAAPHFGRPVEKDDPVHVKDPATGKREKIKTPARPRWVWGHFDKQIPRASGMPTNGGPSEANVSDKPRPMNHLPELSHQERIAVRELTRQRAEALYVLDLQVKKLVRTLKATHEYKNTVMIFTSDNGYFLGEHRMRQGKIKPHEPSLRVPFLIAGPGIPHGQRFDPVTTPGLTATIVQLAHSTMPHPADGLSVVPSFKGDHGWKVPVVTEALERSRVFRKAKRHPAAGFHDPRTSIGIRTAGWKYVRYDDGDGELYDLDKDPNELSSHFGDPHYAKIQRELARVWREYKDCRGASCRAPLPANLQRGPRADRVDTNKQSLGVEKRYGYFR